MSSAGDEPLAEDSAAKLTIAQPAVVALKLSIVRGTFSPDVEDVKKSVLT